MSMFVHKGGGGVKKPQKTVHMVCRWPLDIKSEWKSELLFDKLNKKKKYEKVTKK